MRSFKLEIQNQFVRTLPAALLLLSLQVFVVAQGVDINDTRLLSQPAISKANSPAYDHVVKVLLANGADPNRATIPGVETESFMRDCRTKGETPGVHHRGAPGGGWARSSIDHAVLPLATR